MALFAPKTSFIIPSEFLDDIASRFLLDASDARLDDPISLCFLTELSYWFYLDEYVEEDVSLSTVKFEDFAQQLLQHVKYKPKVGSIKDMLESFKEFKHKVPTCGAIMLNEDLTHVLLVQGYCQKSSWGFPKGKIVEDEKAHKCAIREVMEETGFDISPIIDTGQYLETSVGEQLVRLYLIPGVPMNTSFCPKTKGEIKKVKWFAINLLPMHKNDKAWKKDGNNSTNMFYMVMPFMKPLKRWVSNRCKSAAACQDSNKVLPGSVVGSSANKIPGTASKYPADSRQSSLPSVNILQDEKVDLDRFQKSSEGSPKPKESSVKGKSKKAIQEDESSKGVSKSRPKKAGCRQAETGNAKGAASTSGKLAKQQSGAKGFRSQAWENFKINKKQLNDSLDKIFSGEQMKLTPLLPC